MAIPRCPGSGAPEKSSAFRPLQAGDPVRLSQWAGDFNAAIMRLRTMGGLGLEESAFRRPKVLLLLAYLAVEGPKDRHFLSELFWPAASSRLNSLAKALSQLRHEAPGVIDIGGDRVRLEIESDIGALLRALEGRDDAAVLELYPAPFLEGFHLPNLGPELEEWVFATRESVAARVREAMLRLAEREIEGGTGEQAVNLAEAANTLAAAPALEPEELQRVHALLNRP